MRMLAIAGVLLVLVVIGSYYMVVQELPNPKFTPAPEIVLPAEYQYGELPSPSPLPTAVTHMPAAPSPLHYTRVPIGRANVRSGAGTGVLHVPVPAPLPTSPQVTPLPAPTYMSVTPMPAVHTPPPINAQQVQTVLPQYGATSAPSPKPQSSP